ncbi:MAG TPA: YafY family protein [Terriglobales bacterium]|jgi:predicted DNA-binding transcriptional regulator YafY|nr:YafY family protein [Terriglobales bacterium]
MKADRLLSEVLLLQSRGRFTGRQLAKRLEVSERTVHRDMEALSASGVPVFALRGARGGWQLDEDWRTQVPALDEAELRALLMAQPRVIGDARLAAAAQRALEKLTAALPQSLRERAASIRQRLYVDTTGWRGTSEDLSMLPIVQEAVSRDRKLKIRYWKAEGRPSGRVLVYRVVDPLGLVAKGSTWYLVARTRRGFRTYRVSRIEEATLLERPSQRPENFDLAAWWEASTQRFRASMPQFEAVLHLEPGAAREMKMWHTATEVPPPATGQSRRGPWVTLRVQFADEHEARFIILGMGPRVEVIEPTTLRDRVVAEAAAVVRLASRGARSGLVKQTFALCTPGSAQ